MTLYFNVKNIVFNYSFRNNFRSRYITQYSISKIIETLMLKARRILYINLL